MENEIERLNLTARIEKYREQRNIQKKLIDKYVVELKDLTNEVENIRFISEALPAGCFRRNRLEP